MDRPRLTQRYLLARAQMGFWTSFERWMAWPERNAFRARLFKPVVGTIGLVFLASAALWFGWAKTPTALAMGEMTLFCAAMAAYGVAASTLGLAKNHLAVERNADGGTVQRFPVDSETFKRFNVPLEELSILECRLMRRWGRVWTQQAQRVAREAMLEGGLPTTCTPVGRSRL